MISTYVFQSEAGCLSQDPSLLERYVPELDRMNDDVELDQDILSSRPDSPSSSSSVAQSEAVAKKRRVRYRRTQSFPRVIKTDIRRHYATMIANVFNSHCISLLQSFFATYCTQQLRVEKKFNELSKKPYADQHLLTSTTGILLLAAVGMQLNPDETFTLTNTKVITRSDSDEATIVINFSTSLTTLYDVDPDEVANEMVESAFNLNLSSEPTISASGGSSQDALRSSLGDIVSVVTSSELSLTSNSYDTTSTLSDDTSSAVSHSSSCNIAPSKPAQENRAGRYTSKSQDSLSFESTARIFTPVRKGSPVRLPNAFAFFQARTGRSIPLRDHPQRIQSHNQITLLLNAKRQIECVAMVEKCRKQYHSNESYL